MWDLNFADSQLANSVSTACNVVKVFDYACNRTLLDHSIKTNTLQSSRLLRFGIDNRFSSRARSHVRAQTYTRTHTHARTKTHTCTHACAHTSRTIQAHPPTRARAHTRCVRAFVAVRIFVFLIWPTIHRMHRATTYLHEVTTMFLYEKQLSKQILFEVRPRRIRPILLPTHIIINHNIYYKDEYILLLVSYISYRQKHHRN